MLFSFVSPFSKFAQNQSARRRYRQSASGNAIIFVPFLPIFPKIRR
jgi:hypothetical protein